MRLIDTLKKENGHYIVEASIILPIFLVGVITLSSLLSSFAIGENIIFAAADESRLSMVNSYSIGDDLLLSYRVKKRIADENTNIANLWVYGYKSGFSDNNTDNLVYFKISYNMDLNGIMPIVNKKNYNRNIIFRKFIGNEGAKEGFTFERMETDEDSNIVYIFPNDGVRYHQKNCSYVKPNASEVVLGNDIKKEYKSCTICGTDKAINGTLVYLFKSYGDAYHYKSCSTVEKNYIEIEVEQASEKGYTACLKCGGI